MRLLHHQVRLPVFAILALAWLLASNHCAVASLVGGHRDRGTCCHKESQPKDSKPCAEQCCGALSVPVQVADAVPAPDLFLISPVADLFLGQTDRLPARVVCSGLAPPGLGGSFFVEFVAGSSHQTMAPPVFAV